MTSFHVGADFNDFSIIHAGDSICKIKNTIIMCYDNQGFVRTLHHITENRHHLVTGFVIKAAGRLITNYDLGVMHKCPCYCYAPAAVRRSTVSAKNLHEIPGLPILKLPETASLLTCGGYL